MSSNSPTVRRPAPPLPAPRRSPYSQLPPEEPRRLTLGAVAIAVVCALIVAAVVYAASHKLSPTYQATSEFLITFPNQGGVSDGTITAANDAATEDAQLVSSAPVEIATARLLGVSPATLSGKISGSTVAAQNLVQVTASASSADQANTRAQAAGRAAVTYITALGTARSNSNYLAVTAKLRSLNTEIAKQTAKIKHDSRTEATNDVNILQTLVQAQAQAQTTLAANTASGQANLQLIPSGDNASQTAPKPTEYALIGFVAALVVALRGVYVLGLPRRRRSA